MQNILDLCGNVVPVRARDGSVKLAHVETNGKFYTLVANSVEFVDDKCLEAKLGGENFNVAPLWVSVLFPTPLYNGPLLRAIGPIRDPTFDADKELSYERITHEDALITYHLLLEAAETVTKLNARYPADAVAGGCKFLEFHAQRSLANDEEDATW